MPELYDRILDAVVTTLADKAIDGVGENVIRRRYPDRVNQSYPGLVVSYFGEVESVQPDGWSADWIGVPVLVQYFAPTLTEQGDDVQERELSVRGVVYDALAGRRLAGVPEVTTCVPEPRPVAEPDDPIATNRPQAGPVLLRSGMLYRFMARRARAA